MTVETVLSALLRLNIFGGLTILLLLALRPLVLSSLGARSAYRLWLVLPLVLTGACLPAREMPYVPQSLMLTAAASDNEPVAAGPATFPGTGEVLLDEAWATGSALAEILLVLWLVVAAVLLLRSIVSTRRLAADPTLGPALVGVLRPRLILPPDFEIRFDALERELILAHEDVHRASRHTLVNALIETLRCANWFNPLAHAAARYMRIDQELACDAAVISTRPNARRAYAQALLKTGMSPGILPLGCTWTSRSGRRMAQRIELLAQPPLTLRGAFKSAAVILLLSVGLGYAAWAQQEPLSAKPEPKWTPSSAIPAGENVLSHDLEARRHDFFIELAQQGDIDLVFFGTTDTEMFWWPARGRSEFEKAFANIDAANFGAQGTLPGSLLWRMQNGELDGFEAKLVVFQLWGIGDLPYSDETGHLDGLAPILAEIRARQPQARILLTAPFPRGFARLDEWRRIAEARAARVRPFVDNETVFYIDIGERFYLPDGSHDNAMWARGGISGVGVGIQPAAYAAWAQALQPWLDRFVR